MVNLFKKFNFIKIEKGGNKTFLLDKLKRKNYNTSRKVNKSIII